MTEYNGHKNWTRWNVSLWINNDEGLYHWAYDLVKRYGRARASWRMFTELKGQRTPDGAKYSRIAIFDALDGMVD